jgi:hypothetical protein
VSGVNNSYAREVIVSAGTVVAAEVMIAIKTWRGRVTA